VSSELWAIVSAAAWAADSILVRKGTALSNPSTFIALDGGQLSVVTPLINTTPVRRCFHRAVLARRRKNHPTVLIGLVLLVAGIGFITAR
jgi:uncharacterized membrane protein